AHDRGVRPELRDLIELEIVTALGEQLEAFRVALHHRVLDRVMNHLDVVPGAGSPDVRISVGRRQRSKHWLDQFDGLLLPADHQAIAVLETPDSSRRAGVDESDAEAREIFRARCRIGELGVAPVDEDVTRGQETAKRRDRIVDRFARRDHQPDDARGRKLRDELLERARSDRAVRDRSGDRFGTASERDNLVPATDEPLHHVGAHLSEADETESHHGSLNRVDSRNQSTADSRQSTVAGTISLSSLAAPWCRDSRDPTTDPPSAPGAPGVLGPAAPPDPPPPELRSPARTNTACR